jgi:hypothetical protein
MRDGDSKSLRPSHSLLTGSAAAAAVPLVHPLAPSSQLGVACCCCCNDRGTTEMGGGTGRAPRAVPPRLALVSISG